MFGPFSVHLIFSTFRKSFLAEILLLKRLKLRKFKAFFCTNIKRKEVHSIRHLVPDLISHQNMVFLGHFRHVLTKMAYSLKVCPFHDFGKP